MDRTRWIKLPLWLLALFLLPLLVAQPAVAEDPSAEVQSYERDFGLSQAAAEKNLKIQEQGAGIVGQLREDLGDDYAGVWFDNETGEFIVPLPSNADHKTLNTDLSEAGLEGSFRVVTVESNWENLEETQDQLDKTLSDLIEAQQAQTSLDPRTNAVVLYVADSTSKSNQGAISRLARLDGLVGYGQSAIGGGCDWITSKRLFTNERLTNEPG